MRPSTAHELAETLRQAELLSRAQVVKVAELLTSLSDDPEELAYALVQRKWLTSFQAEQALDGKAKQLVLGGYQLKSLIGTGGMGQVYKAWQRSLDRTVALKVIRPDLIESNPASTRRFQREARAVAKLSHPNIVVIYDFDQADGTYFIAMEYVEGRSLEQLVLDDGPLAWAQASDYIRQAALGLQHAFKAKLVHRDIKPSNLLVTRPEQARRESHESAGDSIARGASYSHGHIKILDMGLARMEKAFESNMSLTREGAMMGTPDYVSPEQAKDASSVDIRADLYSLGCTFFFLLTGRPPFPDGTMMERLLKHQFEPPPAIDRFRADVPPMVQRVIRKLLEKSPDLRFQEPIELAETLSQILGMPSVLSLSPSAQGLELRPAAPGDPSLPTPLPVDSSPLSRTPTQTERLRAAPIEARPAVTVVTAVSLQERLGGESSFGEPREVLTALKASVLRGHTGPVMALAFSPDGRMLATGGLDRTVRLWSLGETPREAATLSEPQLGDVQVLAFSPNGHQIATGSASLDARMWLWSWRLSTGSDRVSFDGGPSYSDSLAYSPDGQSLLSAAGASIWNWSIGDGKPRKGSQIRSSGGGDMKVVSFSPDGKRIVGGDSQGQIHFWTIGRFGGKPGVPLAGHPGGITSLAFSVDGLLLASAGLDHSVAVWDGSGQSAHEKVVIPKLKGVVRRMMFTPDGQFLLTAGDGGQVILWNWSAAEPVHEWRLNQALICSLAVAGDGGFIAAGGSDGTVTLFDLVPD